MEFFKSLETGISLMGLSLIRMVRSVENKTDTVTKEKIRTKEKIDFGLCLLIISLSHGRLKLQYSSYGVEEVGLP